MDSHLAIKRNEVLARAIMWMNRRTMLSEKEPDIRGHILYDSVYIKYPEEANP